MGFEIKLAIQTGAEVNAVRRVLEAAHATCYTESCLRAGLPPGNPRAQRSFAGPDARAVTSYGGSCVSRCEAAIALFGEAQETAPDQGGATSPPRSRGCPVEPSRRFRCTPEMI